MLGGVLVTTSAGYLLISQANSTAQRFITQVNQQFPGEISLGRLQFEGASLALYNFSLKDANGNPLIDIPKATAGVNLGNFWKQRHWLALPGTINIENPSIYATIDQQGQFNFSTLAGKKEKKPFQMPPLRYLGADLHITEGRVVFKDLRGAGFLYQLDNVQLDAQAHPWHNTDFFLSFNPTQDAGVQGLFNLQGHIDPEHPVFSARLSLDNWQLKHLAEYPLARRYVSCHDGLIAASLWAECKAPEWPEVLKHLSYGGSVKLSQGTLMVPQLALPVRQIRANAQIANGLITVKDGFANLEGVGARLEGSVYLPPSPRLDLHLSIPRLRTRLIEQIIRKKLPAAGQASIEVNAEGTFAHPQLSGIVGVDKLTVQGQDLNSCRIKWDFADNIFTVSELKGQAVGGEFQGSGFVYLDKKKPYVVFTLKGQDADLSNLSPVGGKIERFDVNLLGDLQDPLIYGGSSRISDFSGAASQLSSVSGRFLCTKEGIILSSGQADTSFGQVSLPCAFYDIDSSEVLAAVSTDAFNLPTFNIRGFGSISGRLGGSFQVDGSVKDVNSLSLYGFSRNSDVLLNNVLFSDFSGCLGFKNMNLFFPCLSGHGASGDVSLAGWVGFKSNGRNFAYSGDGSVSLLGEGVRLDQLLSVVRTKVPLNISAPSDIGVNWFADGESKGNWARAYAGARPKGSDPFAMAAQAMFVNSELGALAWTDRLPLGHIKITPEIYLDGGVTGQMAAGGPIADLGLAYCANLDHFPLNGLVDDTVQGLGTGRFSQGRLELRDNLFSWEYKRPKLASRVDFRRSITGKATAWLGPEFSEKLKVVEHSRAHMPRKGLLLVNGWYDVKNKAYDAGFDTLGVDLRWLTRQPNLPQLRDTAKKINLTAGFASAQGRLQGDLHHLQLAKGTYFDIPWMLAKRNDDFDAFSGVGSIWNEPKENSLLGVIHVDPLVLSRRPFDPALPYGSQLQNYDWPGNFRQGWLYLNGLIDGPDVSLAMTVDGWDLDSALAFAPAGLSIDEQLWTGLWHSDNLTISLNTHKPLMESLELAGTIGMENGALNFKDWSIPIKEFSASVSQHGPELSLDHILFDTGMQAVRGKGKRNAEGGWEADVWARDIPLNYLSSFHSSLSRLRGHGDLAMHLTTPHSDFSEPTVYLGFEGRDVTLRPSFNRKELFAFDSQSDNDSSAKATLADKIFRKEEESDKDLTQEELAARHEQERQRLRQEFMENLSRTVAFSRFQLGRIERTPEGELYTDSSLGLVLKKDPDNFSLFIPDEALCIEAITHKAEFGSSRRRSDAVGSAAAGAGQPSSPGTRETQNASEQKETKETADNASAEQPSAPQDASPATTLTASGRIGFGLDFSAGIKDWFMGPSGPDFGTPDHPFTVSLDNFTNDMLRSVMGKLPENSLFAVSGDLRLKGQWHRDSRLDMPDSNLDYLLTVNKLNFGHYKEGSTNGDWVGLELDENLEMHYARQDDLGRLIVPAFHIKPHSLANADEETADVKPSKDKKGSSAVSSEGDVTGEADIVLAKGSDSMEQEKESYARLKISNMPVLGIASYLTKTANFGHIDSIDLEAYGPVTSPDFDLAFHVRDGQISKLSYTSIEGTAQGRLQDDFYQIDLGESLDDGLRMYLGRKKSQDWNANVWGQIPLKVQRQKLNYNGRLIPVWEGVSYQENGELDLTLNLTDKQLNTAAEFIPDISKTTGILKSDVHITGAPLSPNASGYLSIEKGGITHNKAGEITDINVEANFDKVPADQLQAEFQERMKDIQARISARNKAHPHLIQRRSTPKGVPPRLPDINRLSLEKCEAQIGGKKLTAGGQADLMGFNPVRVKIDISGKDLPLRWGDLFEGIVDVDAQVDANQRRRGDSSESQMVMVLSGDINVQAGEVGVSLSDASGGGEGEGKNFNWKSVPLYYQLLVNMSDNVWINAYNSRIRTSGTLYIMPNEATNAPQLAGSVDVSRGTLSVPFYDVKFKLRSGQLTFESSNNPVLEDVMAESDVKGYQISTFVDGTYPNINLRFSSYPQLEENEIKQLLALGTLSGSGGVNSNMNNQVPTVGQQQYSSKTWSGSEYQGTAMLSRMLASPITNSISKLLFLSDFSVDINSDNSYSMKIAKAIDPDEKVLFTLTSSYNPRYNYQSNLYGIEWRAKRNLMLRIAADEKGHILPWFQGRWEF